MNPCPCGSGRDLAECCEPVIKGARVAATAEETMRARYTAHTLVELDFLRETLHPDNREDGDEETARRWAERSEWIGLEVLRTEAGGAGDDKGIVEFKARYRDKKGGRLETHHEVSLFEKIDGRWLFRQGEAPEQETLRREAPKVGRNDPCPCDSGKKFKKCCGKAA